MFDLLMAGLLLATVVIYLLGFYLFPKKIDKKEDRKVWFWSYFLLGGYAIAAYCRQKGNTKWANNWVTITTIFMTIQIGLIFYFFLNLVLWLETM